MKIIKGDCREVLPTLDAESVQTVITSPPYWGLRDYGEENQIPDAMGHHATEDMTCENCGMYLPATHWRNPKPCPKATNRWQHRRNR